MPRLIPLADVKKYLSSYINKNDLCICKSLRDAKSNYYICVLEPTDYTDNNEKRADIVNASTAHYRGSEFLVKKIVSLSNTETEINSVNHITNLVNSRVTTLYEVGKKVVAKNYDQDKAVVCSGGISYFLSVDVAYYYGKRYIAIDDKYTGHWEEYYSNGQLMTAFEMVDGLIHLHYIIYSPKGKIIVITKYVNGIVDLRMSWADPDEKINKNSKNNSKNKFIKKIDINKDVIDKKKCCQ